MGQRPGDFVADAANAIKVFSHEEVIYADDLNAYKIVQSSTQVDSALISLGKVQK